LARLERACNAIGLTSNRTEWEEDIQLALAKSEAGRYVIKLVLTRGSSGFGYTPGDGKATRILQLLAYPKSNEQELKCEILESELGSNRHLAGHKHLNRLEQVMAAREVSDRGLQEGLVCDEHGFLVEAVSSNVVLAFDNRIVTPLIQSAGVKGVMRDVLIENTRNTDIRIFEELVFRDVIAEADEIILCNSVRGVRRVARLGERALKANAVYLRLKQLAEKALEATD
ncbi:MAG: aminotransferase class IV, partial [Gammaproteobacteria bacterium]